MKGINHREEGNRHIIQVYYQHNLGKDNQARPCFFSAAGPGGWGGSGAGLAGLGGEQGWAGRAARCTAQNMPVLWLLFLFAFFPEFNRKTPSDF